ncbi:MAG: SpaH/EbpB family LPXTG-anchored major pilin [Clostridia bacterium]|nr:SpaH/EbpB family LPXTG-anchored major pilin [Clostridia bacterium]
MKTKTTKKFLALFLAILMTMAVLTTTAFAAGTGSIKITHTIKDDVYSVYQIFVLDEDQSAEAEGKPVYKVNSDWTDFKDVSGVSDYYTVDTNGYVHWKKDTSAAVGAAFAALAKQYATDNGRTAEKTKTVGTTGEELVFSDLPAGYYLVMNGDKTPGVASVTAGKTTTIAAKDTASGLPTIEKKVDTDNNTGTEDWGDSNNAAFHDTVYFQITITAKVGAAGYVLTDTLADGFTLNEGSIVVKKGGTPLTVGTDYTVDTSVDHVFTLTFEQDFLNTLSTHDQIVVTYNATLTKDAVTGTAGNKNTAALAFYENGHDETTDSTTTTTYTYKIEVTKTAEDGTTPLGDAKFKVYRSSDSKYITDVNSENGAITWGEETAAKEFESGGDGKITIAGLVPDTYYFKETKAPAGYIQLTADESVTITDDNVTLTIKNMPGQPLPETGGIGTTVFYIAGAVLVLGAGMLLVSKKRRHSEN